MMRGDGESAAIFVAIAFLVLGLVAMPEARPFFLGTLVFGAAMAIVLHQKVIDVSHSIRVDGSMSVMAIMHKLRLRRITSGSPTTRPCEPYNPLRCCRHEVVV